MASPNKVQVILFFKSFILCLKKIRMLKISDPKNNFGRVIKKCQTVLFLSKVKIVQSCLYKIDFMPHTERIYLTGCLKFRT